MKNSYVFYESFSDAFDFLDDEQYGKMMRILNKYALKGEVPTFSNDDATLRMAFLLIKPQIDANSRRFEDGKKGGRPSKSEQVQNENYGFAEKKPNVNVNENANVNVNADENENADAKVNAKENVCVARAREDACESQDGSHTHDSKISCETRTAETRASAGDSPAPPRTHAHEPQNFSPEPYVCEDAKKILLGAFPKLAEINELRKKNCLPSLNIGNGDFEFLSKCSQDGTLALLSRFSADEIAVALGNLKKWAEIPKNSLKKTWFPSSFPQLLKSCMDELSDEFFDPASKACDDWTPKRPHSENGRDPTKKCPHCGHANLAYLASCERCGADLATGEGAVDEDAGGVSDEDLQKIIEERFRRSGIIQTVA